MYEKKITMIQLPDQLKDLMSRITNHVLKLAEATREIREVLSLYADSKVLKGDEVVGWIGEVYAKLLLSGVLVGDDKEHDVETSDKRVSVKTRKGNGSGWTRTSAVPRTEGDGCPTHLMFVHLSDDYLLKEVWLYPWYELLRTKRFKEHTTRGTHRSFYMNVKPSEDDEYLYYRRTQSG